MSGVELINQLNDLSVKLRESVSYMRRAGENYARAQNAYKIAVNQEFLRLRADGTASQSCSRMAFALL